MKNDDSEARGASDIATGFLAFTIDPRTARIVKLEALDDTGARHELSREEKAGLVRQRGDGERTLEQVVERAFEAGIACVLDGETEPDERDERLEDVELTHRLLMPLIEHSAAKNLIARNVLDRAMLDTLIEHATASSPGDKHDPTQQVG